MYGVVCLLASQPALQSGNEVMKCDVLLLLLLLFLRSWLVLKTCGPEPYPKVEDEAQVRRWPALQERSQAFALGLAGRLYVLASSSTSESIAQWSSPK